LGRSKRCFKIKTFGGQTKFQISKKKWVQEFSFFFLFHRGGVGYLFFKLFIRFSQGLIGHISQRKRMSSIIEGPLGLSIDQLETIHALVGLRDGNRKRESLPNDNLNPCSSFLHLRQPTRSESHRMANGQYHEEDVDLDRKFDSVLEKYSDETNADYLTGEPPTSKDFCFIFPDDQEYLSEYLFLLFSQVKKGTKLADV
jgi:hypothetical protein